VNESISRPEEKKQEQQQQVLVEDETYESDDECIEVVVDQEAKLTVNGAEWKQIPQIGMDQSNPRRKDFKVDWKRHPLKHSVLREFVQPSTNLYTALAYFLMAWPTKMNEKILHWTNVKLGKKAKMDTMDLYRFLMIILLFALEVR